MKKVLLLLMICILCFCTACTQPQQPDLPTDPPASQNTPQPTEEPTQDTTENTEPPAPAWLPQQTEKLSYEEYFSEDRLYTTDPYLWLVEEEGVYKGYILNLSEDGLQVHAYDPNFWGEPGELLYIVPQSDSLVAWELIGTDGITAYCANNSSIVAVDLVSGTRSWIVNDELITAVYFCGDVLYYAQRIDNQMTIIRRYLPDGHEHYTYTEDTVPAMFRMSPPVSTHGDISWNGVSEEMAAKLAEVLQDPQSKYQQDPDSEGLDGIDLSSLWGNENVLLTGNTRNLQMLCYRIQRDTDIPALRKTQYDQIADTLTEQIGVIDNCWFGSGYSHDHYDPDAAPSAEPVSGIGPWQPFAETMPATETQPLDGRLVLHNHLLYLVSGNTFTRLADTPILEYRQTETAFDADAGAIYAITGDNDLVRVYTDGSAPTVLYSGQSTLYQLSYRGNMFYVIDGDSIVQLDLQTQQYRTVFSHEDLYWSYCDSENVLYIDLTSGLHLASYLYDLTTGELTETGYRL